MKKSKNHGRLLLIAPGMILISIFLMVVIIPSVFTKSLPNAHNTGAVTGIGLAMIIRLLIFLRLRSLNKILQSGGKWKKLSFNLLGVLLILFGLFYSDGAFAFLDNEHIPYVSVIMFGSVFCDLIAAVFTFTANFLKPQKSYE